MNREFRSTIAREIANCSKFDRHKIPDVTIPNRWLQASNLRSVAWILWESLLLGVTFDRTPPPFCHTHPVTRDLKGLPESVIMFCAHNPLMTILLMVFCLSIQSWKCMRRLWSFTSWMEARGSEIGIGCILHARMEIRMSLSLFRHRYSRPYLDWMIVCRTSYFDGF